MEITAIIGWIGVAFIVACNFPQLFSALKYGRKVRVHRVSYTLLLIGVFCHLIRSLAIMEPIFIVSHLISFVCIFIIRYKLNE